MSSTSTGQAVEISPTPTTTRRWSTAKPLPRSADSLMRKLAPYSTEGVMEMVDGLICGSQRAPSLTWLRDASCRGMDTNLFFPVTSDAQKRYVELAAVCADCPVRQECLATALWEENYWQDIPEVVGVPTVTVAKDRRTSGQRASFSTNYRPCGFRAGMTADDRHSFARLLDLVPVHPRRVA